MATMSYTLTVWFPNELLQPKNTELDTVNEINVWEAVSMTRPSVSVHSHAVVEKNDCLQQWTKAYRKKVKNPCFHLSSPLNTQV